MAAQVDLLQQDMFSLTQRINNLENNVIQDIKTSVQAAFTAVHQAAVNNILQLKDNLEEAKKSVDAFAQGQDAKWNSAHNDLVTRFAEHEAQFIQAKVKFDTIEALLTECAQGSFADFKDKVQEQEKTGTQLRSDIKVTTDQLRSDVELTKETIKQGMKIVSDTLDDALVTHMSLKDDIESIIKSSGGDLRENFNK